MLVMSPVAVGLAVWKPQEPIASDEVVLEQVVLFLTRLGSNAVAFDIVADVVVDGHAVGLVDHDATLVRVHNDIL